MCKSGPKNQFILNLQYTSKTDRHPLFRAASGKKAQQILGKWPKTVIADAGYGSEENYAYLEKKEIQAVVKYGSYHKEKTKAWKANVGKIEKLDIRYSRGSLDVPIWEQAAFPQGKQGDPREWL
ncbi:transposase [Paenibacillus rhizoplanae]